MSQQSVKAFYDKIVADQALSGRYKTFLEGSKSQSKPEMAAGVVSFARGEGFDFTESDLDVLEKELRSKPLSDEQLESVAGGVNLTWILVSNTDGKKHGGACFIAGYQT